MHAAHSTSVSRRHLLALFGAGVATVGLAACGGSQAGATASTAAGSTVAGGSAAGTTAAGSATTTAVAAAPAASGQSATVHWLIRSDMGALIDKWEQQTVAAYKKVAPNIAVQSISVPWAQYNAKLLTLFAANQIPEVFATFAAGFGAFLANGALADLGPYLQRVKVDVSTEFDKETIAEVTRGGKLVALPIGHFGTNIFYNATLFQASGIPVPSGTWSDTKWSTDAMLQAATKLTQNSSDPAKRQWGVVFDAQQLGVMSWLWGVDPFNAKGGPQDTRAYQTGTLTEVHYDNTTFGDAMQWIADLALKAKVAPLPSDVNALKQGVGDPFLTGRIGMYLNGQWETQALANLKPQWKWGVAPLPYGPGKVNTSPLYNDSFLLGKGSKAIDQGFDFLRYLTLDTPAENYALSTGFFPARTNLYDKAVQSMAAIPGATQTKEQIKEALIGGYATGFVTPGKTLNNYNEFNTAWGQGTSPIWSGQAPVGPTLQTVQEKFKSLIASQGK